MKIMKYFQISIRRRIEGMLSEGRGAQLLWTFCIIVVSFFMLWGMSRILFGVDAFSWQDIIALCLDPGVFGGAGEHDGFRLLITLIGIVLFAAILISIVSNIFENISDHYKKGEATYHFKNHILIIGSAKILSELLLSILNDDERKFKDRQILIMSDRSSENLRDEIKAVIDNNKFFKRITFYYDKRDKKENLNRANVTEADFIYMLGEDNEINHDLLNLTCLQNILDLGIKESAECSVVMDSQTTMKAFQLFNPSIKNYKSGKNLYSEKDVNPNNVNIVNINECKAELLLRNKILPQVINPDIINPANLNIVIFGMTAIGRAIATTAAYSFHFIKKRHVTITFIDSDITERVDDFIARNRVLFIHSTIVSNVTGHAVMSLPLDDEISWRFIDSNSFQKNVDDEISWRFIDSNSSSKNVSDLMQKLKGTESAIYTFICFDDVRKNLATDIALRNQFGGHNIYSDFGEYDSALQFSVINDHEEYRINDDITSKGFGINYSILVPYTFWERQCSGKNLYKPKNHEPNRTWIDLTYSEKQMNLYESFVSSFDSKSINLDECKRYIRFLMGIGEEGDGSRYYTPSEYKFMHKIYQHFYYSEAAHYDILDDFNSTREDCILLQNSYINSLYSGYEHDIDEFLKFELHCINDRARLNYHGGKECFVLSKDLMIALLDYTKKYKRLSDSCVNVLADITNFIILKEKDDYSNFIYQTILSDFILPLASDIIHEMAEIGHLSACLAMSAHLSNNYDELKIWFLKAIDGHDEKIPDAYYQLIGQQVAEQLYLDTKYENCLDWIIVNMTPEFGIYDLDVDYISSTERTIHNLTKYSGAELFIRLAKADGLAESYTGMWLKKALRSAQIENNNALLFKVLLKLGDYFMSYNERFAYGYYHKAYQMNNKDPRAILGYGRCVYWGIGIQHDKDFAHNIGYREANDDSNWVDKRYELGLYPGWNSEDDDSIDYSSSYDDYINIMKQGAEKLGQMISEWEITYPHIEHPYQKAFEHYRDFIDDNTHKDNVP